MGTADQGTPKPFVWDRERPLDMAEGETPKANQALNDYALLGPARSLANLHQTYTKPAPNGARPPTVHPRILKGWSADFAWQARVAAYDAQVQAREREAYEARWAARREAEREETWQLAQELRAKAKKMLEFPLMDVEQVTARRQGPAGVQHVDMTVIKPARWGFRDVATMAETAAKLARISAELPTDRVAIEDLSPRDLQTMSTDELLLLKQQIARQKLRR